METFAKHFWEKEGKLQETVKQTQWHFHNNNKKEGEKGGKEDEDTV